MPVHCSSPRVRALAFACNSKACAPPPVGTGGSTGTGSKRPATLNAAIMESRTKQADLKDTDEDAWLALHDYMVNGHGDINAVLRGIADEFQVRRASDSVAAMQRVFDAAAVPVPKAVVLHRGMGVPVDVAGDVQRQLSERFAPGTEFVDKGFVSTSEKAALATAFASDHRRSEFPARVKINVPEGTRVLAGHHLENELILAPGTRFRVVSAQVKRGVAVIGGKKDMLDVTVDVVP